MRTLAAVVSISFATASAAETLSFPIFVHQQCARLAEPEHVPIVIQNKYQAAKAPYKLARLNDADPMVIKCNKLSSG